MTTLMKPFLKSTTSLYVLLCLTLLLFPGFNEKEDDSIYKGAWRLADGSHETLKIITNKHFSYATYNIENKKFIAAGGGTWTADGNTYTETLEYYTEDSAKVGSSVVFNSKIEGQGWQVSLSTPGSSVKQSWTKVDKSSKSPLAGTWRITQRVTPEGEKVTMPRRSRKTLKFLSDNYFQWAAINPETKEFFGTGGGIYNLKDGKYTEHINFFSRDSSRVGMDLTFNYEVNGDAWHHTGKSTTGNKVDEVWTKED
ncbi:MAG TPA: membrane or secreted protein [Cytophagales bacterium]|nr:membrane or secreted protein [Cytophagales bacterium]